MFCCELPVPLVTGALHWMICIKEGNETELMIMAFDVNSEIFTILALPDDYIKAKTFQSSLASFKGNLLSLHVHVMNNWASPIYTPYG